jgi:nucleotide-binding universal stress UspA family protein
MKRFKNILYLIETDEQTACGLERAINLARANQARLTVAAVSEDACLSNPGGIPEKTAGTSPVASTAALELERRVRELLSPVVDAPEIETRVFVGTPFLELARNVRRLGYDLVIKCVAFEGAMGRLSGSREMSLLRECPCPVWLSRPTAGAHYRRIVAAVDVGQDYPRNELRPRSELNRQILELASSLALAEFAELHVAHVWNALGEDVMRIGLMTERPDNMQINAYVDAERQRHANALEAALAALENHIGADAVGWLNPVRHLPKGSPREELPALVKRIDADVLVMGTVARTGVAGLLMGNTAEAVLKQVDCSILAVKPPGFAGGGSL